MDADEMVQRFLDNEPEHESETAFAAHLANLLRRYAASRLREAAGELDDLAAGWRGDGRTHEVVRLCTRMVAKRAAAEERG